MAIKVGMVSLGCAKNQVDGEMLMANLKNAGFELCDDAALADVAIGNTCGVIDSAKKESIDEILELATLKKEGRIKKIVVTGCLAERYREEIHKELPEVDGVFGIGANADIAACIESAMNDFTESFPEKSKMPLCGERELSTPSYFAYIKIAEGCDNKCTYCAIPMIRGGYRSRTMESIEKLDTLFSPDEKAARIYVNFCNPWQKAGDHKRRLTHTRQLNTYKKVLAPGGELWFKTDNTDLYLATQRYLAEAGFEILCKTDDLHSEDAPGNIQSEHEVMFTAEGIKTKAIIARWNGEPETPERVSTEQAEKVENTAE